MSASKLVFLIADGMGDWPVDELGGMTPLDAASTPHMDALAREGAVGLCRTIPDGMPPGSDIANMALLGCDPAQFHTGRGPIEAAAQGLALQTEDLVWRCNLVRVSALEPDGIMLDYSAGHIDTPTATQLIRLLQDRLGGKGADFHPGVQYRHLVVQPGKVSAPEATLGIRPPHDILDQQLGPDIQAYQQCPELWRLVQEAAELLDNGVNNSSQANAIWLWGQGRPLHLPHFTERFGRTGAVISAVDLVKGLGRAMGMAVLEVPGATGYLDTNYAGKVAAALQFLEQGDFVFLHVEAPDECGHQGSLENKVRAIADFDAQVVGPVLSGLQGRDVAVLVACDHLTPLVKRTHVSDPVPFLFRHPATVGPSTPRFTENLAASTGLILERGEDLLPWALRQSAGKP
ncbi:2,3-bisphosphoglycerate-independent phosphoglycerate mutase [Desulfonatronum thiosulfatophilum]|uniref:2,3-bisphosphoglycerate-independent phosphoglycerate mutase n=1 Tax=Desulfonatronum thiosulfatophilum TaxID=617002 RepID=A0A1G6A878_9BACT|nr:cofactor-independent phosphoglycerate mutase [Desulfonatronum thiosulfatophilum]SDB04638.1 2,3-bisphosphoglycerate-independent phosphoglycerate mutase [Desulfonatronum thiosulfatophilum]